METYKLFRIKGGKLFPLYVEAKRELPMGEWLNAGIGEKADDTHVKASGCGGKLSLRPGFHSTLIPFTDWIGKRVGGKLVQRKDTVWCRCEVRGKEHIVTNRNGSKELLNGWYRFRTNAQQKDPWIISNEIMILEILTRDQVCVECRKRGVEPQEIELT